MQARDIHTFRFLDREPTLKDVLSVFPFEVSSLVLGLKVSDEAGLAAACTAIVEPRLGQLQRIADLMLSAERMDKDDVEKLAQAANVPYASADSAYGILYEIIGKVGADTAEERLIQALRPGVVERGGVFAEFDAPPLDIATGYKPLAFINQLETALENQLSPPPAKERRLVKVRPELVDSTGSIYVNVYFQRPHTDGRDIRLDPQQGAKKIEAKMFAQSAGSTYFVIRARKTKSRIVLRTPGSTLAKQIRTAVGLVVWKNGSAVKATPSLAYDLSVFKDARRRLKVVDRFATRVDSIVVSEIRIHTTSGNVITLKTIARTGDALEDFHKIAHRNADIMKGGTVESVVLRFLPIDDKRSSVAVARVYPDRIRIDEEDFKIVNAHLKEWGVISD